MKSARLPSQTVRVPREKEIRLFGEYRRTQGLVLEAWDQMEAIGDFKAIGV